MAMAAAAARGRAATVAMVAAWYASNVGILLLNKYLLSSFGFRYPIFLTLCHMAACSLLSYAAVAWAGVAPLQPLRTRAGAAGIAALGLVFCVSVVGGNVSLRYIPVSFNQAVGATTPFFTAVLSYVFTGRRESSYTYAALVPVVTGVVIASWGEPSFHFLGFVMCIAATSGRALKTVLQENILSSERTELYIFFGVLSFLSFIYWFMSRERLDTINLLLYMAPVAVILLLPATIIIEENVVGITIALAREDSKIIWYLLFNSCLAFIVNLTNFLVTRYTSGLTLQVLGNAKGAVAVVVSILIFRNPVSVTGILGYSLAVAGIFLYSKAKKCRN